MPAALRLRLAPLATLLAAGFALAGCVSMEPPQGPPRKETLLAATAAGELIRFNADQPSRVLSRVGISGLDSGDRLVGIDLRISRGVLFALVEGTLDDAAFDIADVGNAALAALRQGSVTRLHLLDLNSGRATPLGRVADGQALTGLAIKP